MLAFVLVVVFSSLIFGIGYAQKKRAEQQLLMQTSSALIAPAGKETPLPVMLNIATGTDSGETKPSETIPVLLAMDGTPSATPSPTPTLRLGPNQTGQPTTHGGNPTAWPTTGPGTPTVQIPTSEPPTSEPPTAVPPTSEPPTALPPTSRSCHASTNRSGTYRHSTHMKYQPEIRPLHT